MRNENGENIILSKTYSFAIRIVRLYQYLVNIKKEFVLSKQILRSGTAIGAIMKESEHAQSKADFLNKTSQALKEANETEYWLQLLCDTNYINQNEYDSIMPECDEITSILVSIVKTTKNNLNKNV